mgnify:CR=1 FL=1
MAANHFYMVLMLAIPKIGAMILHWLVESGQTPSL